MNTILKIAVAAGALLAATASPLGAAQPSESQASSNGHPGIILRGSDVLNAKVFSQEGEQVGHLRDVLMDPKTGNISHAVLGMGGWQGIGEKFMIVPWKLIKQDEQRAENYVIQVEREKVRTAPTFERDQWATVIQPDYLSKVQTYFASSPQTKSTTPPSSSAPAPASPPTVEQPQTAQKPPSTPAPEQQKQQAQQRQRKESEQKQRQSAGRRSTDQKE